MKLFRGKWIAAVALALTAITVVGEATASANPWRDRPGRPGWGNREDFISRTINQRFEGRNTLPIRAWLGLDERFNGRQVEYVILNASTDLGRGQATLMVNNMPTGASQTIGTWNQDYFFYTDSYRNVLGRDIQTLQFDIQGRFLVNSITVKLSPGYGGGAPDFVQVPVNRQFVGDTILPVRQMLNIGGQFRGKQVEYIVLRARTDFGRGVAWMRVDGRDGAAQNIGTWTQDYYFAPDSFNNTVDVNLFNLELFLRGRFTVDSIAVKFRAGGGNYPPAPPSPYPPSPPTPPAPPTPPTPPAPPAPYPGDREVTVTMNQRFDGQNEIDLDHLMDLAYRYNGRRIESIRIVASTEAGRGQAQVSINGSLTGMAQEVGTALQTYNFPVAWGGNVIGRDIRDVGMSLRGRFFVQSITVVMGR